jgi:hypothetical protein
MRTRALAASLAAAAVLVVPACSGDDSISSADTDVAGTAGSDEEAAGTTGATGTSEGAATAEVCAARDELRTSLTDLASVNVIQDGTDALQGYIDRVSAALGDLRDASQDAYTSETDAVDEALQDVRDSLDAGVSAENIQDAVQSIGTLAAAGADLLDAIEGAC